MHILLAIYSAIVLGLVLWPYQFVIPCGTCVNGAALNLNASKIEFLRPGLVKSIVPPHGLPEQLNRGQGLTIEAWISSTKPNQFGPARIVTYSQDPFHRNFSLGQHGSDLVLRMRTSHSHPTGMSPPIIARNVFTTGGQKHVMVSYDFSNCRIYVNGKLQKQSRAIKGDFSNWDPDYPLLLGNERTGDRPWLGTIEQLALYQGSMPPAEVVAHYQQPSSPSLPRSAVAAFDFSEVTDGIIRDQSPLQPIISMAVPTVYNNEGKPPFLSPKRRFIKDFMSNFIIFLPLGLLVFSVLDRSCTSVLRTLATTGVILLLYALATEVVQYYIEGRTSALWDLSSCVVGSMVGSFIGWRSRFRLASGSPL